MQEYVDNFVEAFILGIPNLLVALAIFVVSLYLAKVASNLIRRVLVKRNAPVSVTHLLAQLTLWTIIVAGTITALQRFFNVTAFLTGLGILGFTVGFALQDIMKNFAAGVILLLQQPFHVGEFIGVAGFDGTVLQIDLRTTEIKALDGRIVILPNADILTNPIINYTRADRRRIELSVGVAYNTDLEVARQTVVDAIQNVPGYVPEPEPFIGFSNFGDSALELHILFWFDTKSSNPLLAKDAAFSVIKNAFDKKGIDIPFPIRMVYTHGGNDAVVS